MTSPNSREIEEMSLWWNSLERALSEKDKLGYCKVDAIDLGFSIKDYKRLHQELQKAEQIWFKKGYEDAESVHKDELQKARERLLAEIIKDVNTMWIDELSRKEREDGATAIGYSRVVAYLSKKDQSELDQPDALTK